MAAAEQPEASMDAFIDSQPSPLVALVGLPQLHKSLTSRQYRADELHANYVSLEMETTFLDYLPSGAGAEQHVVLKKDWLHKHTHATAAIVSLWFAWDSDVSTAGILATLDKFRSRCRPNCKIIVILAQRRAVAETDDRLSELRKKAELDTKSLLLLLTEGEGDNARVDEAGARKVEKILLESAIAYYKDESRRNKKAKQLGAAPNSSKGAPHLVARHHFKRAYYSEFRRDTSSAAKHWSSCYSNLLELLKLVVSSNESERSQVPLSEVKRVANFVNIKICRGIFATGKPQDAFEAFRKHMRKFRPLVLSPGAAKLADPTGAIAAAAGVVHWGWLYKQYHMFAKLIESPTFKPLLGNRARGPYGEPGYYFQAAASCALERRKCAEKLCAAKPPDGGSDTLIDGRPWRSVAADLGIKPEADVRHDSSTVIELLTNGYEHFKERRYQRMILFIASQTAEEYYYIGNYDKAKQFFERVSNFYQKERWWTVLAHIQRCLRTCAEQLRNLQQFVKCSVALLNNKLSDAAAANGILQQLHGLVRLSPSAPSAFPPLSATIALDVQPEQELLGCVASWSPPQIHLGSSSTLTLKLNSSLVVPLTATSVQLVSSDKQLSRTINATTPSAASDGGEAADGGLPLLMPPGGALTLSITFTPKAEGNITLQQESEVSIALGREPCAIHLVLPLLTLIDDDEAAEQPQLVVNPPLPKLSLDFIHNGPVLVQEAAAVQLLVHTNEDECYSAQLELQLAPADELQPPSSDSAGFTPISTGGDAKSSSPAPAPAEPKVEAGELPRLFGPKGETLGSGSPALQLERISKGSTYTANLTLSAYSPRPLKLTATIVYSAMVGSPMRKVTATFPIDVAPALRVTSAFLLSAEQRQRGHLCTDELVQLLVRAHCVAPPPVRLALHSIRLLPARRVASVKLGSAKESKDESGGDPLLAAEGNASIDTKGVVLGTDGEYSALFAFRSTCSVSNASLGTICTSWTRMQVGAAESGGKTKEATPSEMMTPLPEQDVRPADFEITRDLPTGGTLGQLLRLRVRITNRATTLRMLRLSFSENEAFLFCGFKLFNFQLPPNHSHLVEFNLLPILTGAVQLPPVRLTCTTSNKELLDAQTVHRVFVLPAEPVVG
ncbi:hypothetical protein AB1Y20_005361 [Prymnesium parvum]|uniref:Trafficking protein particle complex subunit 11 n=1 Tax=Prymnesium parvum TaxID=97485 RepID=A0AB34J428_PRYPA